MNLKEASMDDVSNLKTNSFFSTKLSIPDKTHMGSMFQKKRSVAGPFLQKGNQMVLMESSTRLLSPDYLNQSLTSYPAASDQRRWAASKPANSSINDRSSIVHRYYDVKESPRGFRYADSAAEKYIKNVVINSEFDTEPTAMHNQ